MTAKLTLALHYVKTSRAASALVFRWVTGGSLDNRTRSPQEL
jgi:hypothetical protein